MERPEFEDYINRYYKALEMYCDWLEQKKNQTIPSNRFAEKFVPPFRLGRKEKRAILDANGIDVVILPVGNEEQAQNYCDYLNGL